MDPYASAGVDEEREQDVFATAMRPWLPGPPCVPRW